MWRCYELKNQGQTSIVNKFFLSLSTALKNLQLVQTKYSFVSKFSARARENTQLYWISLYSTRIWIPQFELLFMIFSTVRITPRERKKWLISSLWLKFPNALIKKDWYYDIFTYTYPKLNEYAILFLGMPLQAAVSRLWQPENWLINLTGGSCNEFWQIYCCCCMYSNSTMHNYCSPFLPL